MKKLLKVSLVAMLAVGPVAAFAAPAAVPYANGNSFDLTSKPASITASGKIASQSYVQGAYNELAGAINAEQDYVGALPNGATATTIVGYIDEAVTNAGGQTATQVQNLIDSSLAAADGNGLAWDSTAKKFNVDLAATNAGLSVDSTTGKLSADVYEVKDSSTNGNIVVNGAEVTVFDASGYQTALNSTDNTLNGAYITDSTISESKLDTTLQSKIDGALQSADLNGYATETYVAGAISSAITNTYSASDSTHAVTGSAVAGALADYTTTSDLESTYATKTYVDNKKVEVVETWGSSAVSQVALVNAQ